MKKILVICLLILLLAGCGSPKTFETVADNYTEPVHAEAWQILVRFPPEAALSVLESDDTAGKLYLCDGYALTVQTLEAGDLNRTLKEITGFSKDALMVIETAQGGQKRYDCAWTAAGEGGEQTCRAAVLDDGNYNYVITVMADCENAGALQEAWKGIFDSFTIINTGT